MRARYWAVIPAAGVGRRMGASVPKQYLDLAGRPVIEWSLGLFLEHPQISGVSIALDPGDRFWPRTAFADHSRVRRVDGGGERCHSVLNALHLLAQEADAADWVLVHDAARPCLRRDDLDRLLATLPDHPVGGLLGVPVRDTMKQATEDGAIGRTVPRDALWHAFTPQVFRLGLLRRALRTALDQDRLVTDDAAAVELLGLEPMLVEGHADNIKITRPEDLPLADFYLRQQGRLHRER
ncbi:2-C-methyl-D-erythritol 4-phosphate cytidylyltransferase [Candidatus Thiosymbion oneisti]|uniref:2-C-methyl-D-erythritol 4-phosphate cytidylyltransferase n=1 Tax=Candidatus Thiosymbion oneisti TaxID=589554 RepID=UPI000AA4968B|nr:2-C-methyl-D-erythritol 4-phosphate cytidylyltransferase [Candidatus Thiosymbion oneisti]